MLNALALAVTLSLKLMVMLEPTDTFVAPFAGGVLATAGAMSTRLTVAKENTKSTPWCLADPSRRYR